MTANDIKKGTLPMTAFLSTINTLTRGALISLFAGLFILVACGGGGAPSPDVSDNTPPDLCGENSFAVACLEGGVIARAKEISDCRNTLERDGATCAKEVPELAVTCLRNPFDVTCTETAYTDAVRSDSAVTLSELRTARISDCKTRLTSNTLCGGAVLNVCGTVASANSGVLFTDDFCDRTEYNPRRGALVMDCITSLQGGNTCDSSLVPQAVINCITDFGTDCTNDALTGVDGAFAKANTTLAELESARESHCSQNQADLDKSLCVNLAKSECDPFASAIDGNRMGLLTNPLCLGARYGDARIDLLEDCNDRNTQNNAGCTPAITACADNPFASACDSSVYDGRRADECFKSPSVNGQCTTAPLVADYCAKNLFSRFAGCDGSGYNNDRVVYCIDGANSRNSNCKSAAFNAEQIACFANPYDTGCDTVLDDDGDSSTDTPAQVNRLAYCGSGAAGVVADNSLCDGAVADVCGGDPFHAFCFADSGYQATRESTCRADSADIRCPATITSLCTANPFTQTTGGSPTNLCTGGDDTRVALIARCGDADNSNNAGCEASVTGRTGGVAVADCVADPHRAGCDDPLFNSARDARNTFCAMGDNSQDDTQCGNARVGNPCISNPFGNDIHGTACDAMTYANPRYEYCEGEAPIVALCGEVVARICVADAGEANPRANPFAPICRLSNVANLETEQTNFCNVAGRTGVGNCDTAVQATCGENPFHTDCFDGSTYAVDRATLIKSCEDNPTNNPDCDKSIGGAVTVGMCIDNVSDNAAFNTNCGDGFNALRIAYCSADATTFHANCDNRAEANLARNALIETCRANDAASGCDGFANGGTTGATIADCTANPFNRSNDCNDNQSFQSERNARRTLCTTAGTLFNSLCNDLDPAEGLNVEGARIALAEACLLNQLATGCDSFIDGEDGLTVAQCSANPLNTANGCNDNEIFTSVRNNLTTRCNSQATQFESLCDGFDNIDSLRLTFCTTGAGGFDDRCDENYSLQAADARKVFIASCRDDDPPSQCASLIIADGVTIADCIKNPYHRACYGTEDKRNPDFIDEVTARDALCSSADTFFSPLCNNGIFGGLDVDAARLAHCNNPATTFDANCNEATYTGTDDTRETLIIACRGATVDAPVAGCEQMVANQQDVGRMVNDCIDVTGGDPYQTGCSDSLFEDDRDSRLELCTQGANARDSALCGNASVEHVCINDPFLVANNCDSNPAFLNARTLRRNYCKDEVKTSTDSLCNANLIVAICDGAQPDDNPFSTLCGNPAVVTTAQQNFCSLAGPLANNPLCSSNEAEVCPKNPFNSNFGIQRLVCNGANYADDRIRQCSDGTQNDATLCNTPEIAPVVCKGTGVSANPFAEFCAESLVNAGLADTAALDAEKLKFADACAGANTEGYSCNLAQTTFCVADGTYARPFAATCNDAALTETIGGIRATFCGTGNSGTENSADCITAIGADCVNNPFSSACTNASVAELRTLRASYCNSFGTADLALADDLCTNDTAEAVCKNGYGGFDASPFDLICGLDATYDTERTTACLGAPMTADNGGEGRCRNLIMNFCGDSTASNGANPFNANCTSGDYGDYEDARRTACRAPSNPHECGDTIRNFCGTIDASNVDDDLCSGADLDIARGKACAGIEDAMIREDKCGAEDGTGDWAAYCQTDIGKQNAPICPIENGKFAENTCTNINPFAQICGDNNTNYITDRVARCTSYDSDNTLNPLPQGVDSEDCNTVRTLVCRDGYTDTQSTVIAANPFNAYCGGSYENARKSACEGEITVNGAGGCADTVERTCGVLNTPDITKLFSGSNLCGVAYNADRETVCSQGGGAEKAQCQATVTRICVTEDKVFNSVCLHKDDVVVLRTNTCKTAYRAGCDTHTQFTSLCEATPLAPAIKVSCAGLGATNDQYITDFCGDVTNSANAFTDGCDPVTYSDQLDKACAEGGSSADDACTAESKARLRRYCAANPYAILTGCTDDELGAGVIAGYQSAFCMANAGDDNCSTDPTEFCPVRPFDSECIDGSSSTTYADLRKTRADKCRDPSQRGDLDCSAVDTCNVRPYGASAGFTPDGGTALTCKTDPAFDDAKTELIGRCALADKALTDMECIDAIADGATCLTDPYGAGCETQLLNAGNVTTAKNGRNAYCVTDGADSRLCSSSALDVVCLATASPFATLCVAAGSGETYRTQRDVYCEGSGREFLAKCDDSATRSNAIRTARGLVCVANADNLVRGDGNPIASDIVFNDLCNGLNGVTNKRVSICSTPQTAFLTKCDVVQGENDVMTARAGICARNDTNVDRGAVDTNDILFNEALCAGRDGVMAARVNFCDEDANAFLTKCDVVQGDADVIAARARVCVANTPNVIRGGEDTSDILFNETLCGNLAGVMAARTSACLESQANRDCTGLFADGFTAWAGVMDDGKTIVNAGAAAAGNVDANFIRVQIKTDGTLNLAQGITPENQTILTLNDTGLSSDTDSGFALASADFGGGNKNLYVGLLHTTTDLGGVATLDTTATATWHGSLAILQQNDDSTLASYNSDFALTVDFDNNSLRGEVLNVGNVVGVDFALGNNVRFDRTSGLISGDATLSKTTRDSDSSAVYSAARSDEIYPTNTKTTATTTATLRGIIGTEGAVATFAGVSGGNNNNGDIVGGFVASSTAVNDACLNVDPFANGCSTNIPQIYTAQLTACTIGKLPNDMDSPSLRTNCNSLETVLCANNTDAGSRANPWAWICNQLDDAPTVARSAINAHCGVTGTGLDAAVTANENKSVCRTRALVFAQARYAADVTIFDANRQCVMTDLPVLFGPLCVDGRFNGRREQYCHDFANAFDTTYCIVSGVVATGVDINTVQNNQRRICRFPDTSGYPAANTYNCNAQHIKDALCGATFTNLSNPFHVACAGYAGITATRSDFADACVEKRNSITDTPADCTTGNFALCIINPFATDASVPNEGHTDTQTCATSPAFSSIQGEIIESCRGGGITYSNDCGNASTHTCAPFVAGRNLDLFIDPICRVNTDYDSARAVILGNCGTPPNDDCDDFIHTPANSDHLTTDGRLIDCQDPALAVLDGCDTVLNRPTTAAVLRTFDKDGNKIATSSNPELLDTPSGVGNEFLKGQLNTDSRLNTNSYVNKDGTTASAVYSVFRTFTLGQRDDASDYSRTAGVAYFAGRARAAAVGTEVRYFAGLLPYTDFGDALRTFPQADNADVTADWNGHFGWVVYDATDAAGYTAGTDGGFTLTVNYTDRMISGTVIRSSDNFVVSGVYDDKGLIDGDITIGQARYRGNLIGVIGEFGAAAAFYASGSGVGGAAGGFAVYSNNGQKFVAPIPSAPTIPASAGVGTYLQWAHDIQTRDSAGVIPELLGGTGYLQGLQSSGALDDDNLSLYAGGIRTNGGVDATTPHRLSLDGTTLGGDVSDGVAYFSGLDADGTTPNYHAGLFVSTNVGAILPEREDVPVARISWSGTLGRVLGNNTGAIQHTGAFTLDLDLFARTFTGSGSAPVALMRVSGGWHATTGVIINGVSKRVLSTFEVIGTLTGLIGTQGAIGAFVGTRGVDQYAGGFFASGAVPDPAPPAPPPPVIAEPTSDETVTYAHWAYDIQTSDGVIPELLGGVGYLQGLQSSGALGANLLLYAEGIRATGGANPSTSTTTPLRLSLDGTTFGGDASDGVAYFTGLDADATTPNYHAGLFTSTDVGAILPARTDDPIARLSWSGTLGRVLGNNSGAIHATGAFTLNLNLFDRTFTGVGLAEVSRMRVSGGWDETTGVITNGESKRLTFEGNENPNAIGTLTGLIGTQGAIGVFRSVNAGADQYAGGFVASGEVPEPPPMPSTDVAYADWVADGGNYSTVSHGTRYLQGVPKNYIPRSNDSILGAGGVPIIDQRPGRAGIDRNNAHAAFRFSLENTGFGGTADDGVAYFGSTRSNVKNYSTGLFTTTRVGAVLPERTVSLDSTALWNGEVGLVLDNFGDTYNFKGTFKLKVNLIERTFEGRSFNIGVGPSVVTFDKGDFGLNFATMRLTGGWDALTGVITNGVSSLTTTRNPNNGLRGSVTGLIGVEGAVGAFIGRSGVESYAGGFVASGALPTPPGPAPRIAPPTHPDVRYDDWAYSVQEKGGEIPIVSGGVGYLQGLQSSGNLTSGTFGVGGTLRPLGGSHPSTNPIRSQRVNLTDVNDGVSYFTATRNGSVNYHAGLFPSTIVGASLPARIAGTPIVSWNGILGIILGNDAAAIHRQGTFRLEVNMGTRTFTGANFSAGLDGIRLSGSWNANGVIDGVSGRTTLSGTITGLIGVGGAVGAFASVSTGADQWVGGFVATAVVPAPVAVPASYQRFYDHYSVKTDNTQLHKTANAGGVTGFLAGSANELLDGGVSYISVTDASCTVAAPCFKTTVRLGGDASSSNGFGLFHGHHTTEGDRYRAGILFGTDLGAVPASTTAAATWRGDLYASNNLGADGNPEAVPITLGVNFATGTVRTSDPVTVVDGETIAIDGRFGPHANAPAAAGVLGGFVNYKVGANAAIPLDLIGAIGANGALGVFHGTVAGKSLVGGFEATDRPANGGIKNPAIVADKQGAHILNTAPFNANTVLFANGPAGDVAVTLSGSITDPDIGGFYAFTSDSNTTIPTNNVTYYAGLNNVNVGAVLPATVFSDTGLATARWSGKMGMYYGTPTRVTKTTFIEQDFVLSVTLTHRTFTTLIAGTTLRYGTDSNINNNPKIRIGGGWAANSNVITNGIIQVTIGASLTSGTISGMIGTRGIVGAFASESTSAFNPYAGGFFAKPQ